MTTARLLSRRRFAARAGLLLVGLVSALRGAGAASAEERPRFDGHLSQFIYLKPLAPVRPARFRDGDGRGVDFARFRGKVVLVNLWATWCAPCAAEMPTLDRLQARLGGDRFAVVAIALDADGLPPVAAFFRQNHLTHLHIYLDPRHQTIRSGAGDATAAPLSLYELPTSYLLDQRGRMVGYLTGPADWDSSAAIRFLQYFIAANRKTP